jgi:uncharacterized membrane protein YfcA
VHPVEYLALVAVLAGAGAQVVTGIGFSLVCAPLLTVALGGGDGVRLANTLAIAVNLLVLRREWRAVDLRQTVLLLVPASAAAVATAWAIGGVTTHALSVACGCLVLVAIGSLAAGLRFPRLAGQLGAVVAGLVSGAMNVVGGVAGPAVAGYALNARWSAARMRSTLAGYFLGINAVSVLSRGVPSLPGQFFVGGLAAVFGGFGLGALFAGRLNEHAVRWGTLLLAAAGAIAAVVQGVR